jgi:lysyl-tRNA synthetase, class II
MTMNDEAEVRREKMKLLEAAGMPAYSAEVHRTAEIGQAVEQFDAWAEAAKPLTLAGRVMTTRVHGALVFADVKDASGKIQFLLKQDEIGETLFALFRDAIDPADFVEATGVLFLTKRGEKTLQVQNWRILGKALLPLPEKFHGLQDVEKRFREREMDVLTNPEVRQRFIVRSKLVSSLRRFLDERGFLEVETPVLQPIPGGANARPFITHHNALDIDLYLRIAEEVYLKRLVVGGFEKVYEIGRNFWNEGIDYAHNPEFSMLELYWAYATKEEYIVFLEEMMTTIVRDAVGGLTVPFEETSIDFTAPWPRLTFREAIMRSCGIDIGAFRDPDALVKAASDQGLKIDFSECVGLGEHYDQLYKKTARSGFVQPTWVLDYPVELKPLAGRSPEDPTKSACAQLIVNGAEVMNVYYHELTDPTEQRHRFEEQQELREQGSEEAQRQDDAFLRSLEHGMPPTSGMGLGIDRLCAFITNASSIKEVILFPTLRPEHESSTNENV